jgi:hypothetical protein
VYVHVGEPKTGTTFLQQVLWTNKEELLEAGLLMPGPRPMAHWRAAQDLREVPQIPNDPVGPNKGAWDRLVRQALRTPKVAVISHELLAAATAEQAERGIRSLSAAQVHLVLTVRDFGTLLPAEWQETVKHRNTRAWSDWLADVIDREAVAPNRRAFWFWRVHDTIEILRMWGAQLPPERVHVITMPPRGSAPNLLWHRFAGVIGIDPALADTGRARSNASLGLAEVELLRRVNGALPKELPGWFYMRNVKDALAHGALAGRPSALPRLALPPDRRPWAVAHAEEVIAELRAAEYDIVGDLDELLPPPEQDRIADPSDVTAEQMLDGAVVALTALLGVVAKSQGLQADGAPSAVPGRPVEESSRSAGPVRARLIRLSERNRTLFRVRRAYWHLANAARQLRSSARPGPSASGN